MPGLLKRLVSRHTAIPLGDQQIPIFLIKNGELEIEATRHFVSEQPLT